MLNVRLFNNLKSIFMKKTTFYASLMLAASLALASCEKPDEPDNTETTPLATPVLTYETTRFLHLPPG